MKINRYELPQNPSAKDLETLSFLQVAQRNREQRLAALAEGMTEIGGYNLDNLGELLTINGVVPALPDSPVC